MTNDGSGWCFDGATRGVKISHGKTSLNAEKEEWKLKENGDEWMYEMMRREEKETGQLR